MTHDWNAYLERLFAWIGTGSAVVASAAPASAAIPHVGPAASPPNGIPAPLIFERSHTNSVPGQFAGHSSHASHASHASHSSHYSGSGGGYDSSPDSSTLTPLAPSSPATRVAPPASEQDKLVMVMRVQAKLHDLGYYTGTINGTFGDSTKEALRRYQLVKGLPATAKMDDTTLVSLGITY